MEKFYELIIVGSFTVIITVALGLIYLSRIGAL